jgi:sulfatase modifying factor 1
MKMLLSTLCLVLLFSLLVISSYPQPATEMRKTRIGKDGAEMVLIPAGEFQMGTDIAEIPGLVQWLKGLCPDWYIKADLFEDETPRHTVYVDDFYMDKYEVTNKQYRMFVQATGRNEPEGFGLSNVNGTKYTGTSGFKPWADKNYNCDKQPVVCISYEDAKAYAEWAGKRLPTEAEWEKVARGGLVGKRYPWGDDWPPPAKSGNLADEAFKKAFPEASSFIPGYDDSYAYTAPVGSFNPNGYGLYDIAGNVWEWCGDWYDNGYYGKSPKQNPKGPDSGTLRVLRGGSWQYNYAGYPRAACRYYAGPSIRCYFVGFRCVVQD